MFQSGDGPPAYGWRWAHKVSNDLVHWFSVDDALNPSTTQYTHVTVFLSRNTSKPKKGPTPPNSSLSLLRGLG